MLFLREIKKIIFSIPYALFVIVFILDLFSQGLFTPNLMREPKVGEDYGFKNEEIPEIIMPEAFQSLYSEFQFNDYVTYPIGFIKHVKLNDKEQMEIAEILSYTSGINKDEIFNSGENTSEHNAGQMNLAPRSDIAYSEFKEQMGKADKILGGGSSYEDLSLIGFGTVPIDYDEAVERYNLAISSDKITGGYARLFSDYSVTIGMSILPVFLAIILCMKDKPSKMNELIYTRKTSASKIIFTRYFALLAASMLPTIILSYISNASIWGIYSGMELDYLAPLKYDLGWILPSIMISTALGMFFTELTNTPIAVIIQGFWWLFDINMGIKSVALSYSLFRLAPRHNSGAYSFFRTQDFLDNFNNLVLNRLLFAGASLLLVAITIYIYKAKRKGHLNGSIKFKKTLSIWENRKNKSEA